MKALQAVLAVFYLAVFLAVWAGLYTPTPDAVARTAYLALFLILACVASLGNES